MVTKLLELTLIKVNVGNEHKIISEVKSIWLNWQTYHFD